MRSSQRSQAVVEFGIVAITFSLIMFAIADFGLLLNDWLSVSSGVRLLDFSPSRCDVPLRSTVTMRFEGDVL